MSKTQNAQKALQAVYDFHASGEADRVDEIRIKCAEERMRHREADPDYDPDPLMELRRTRREERPVDEYDIEKMSVYESLIAAAGLERSDFLQALTWLAKRRLLQDDHYSVRRGGQIPSLSAEGEDIIDFGITVDEWYHGPYKNRHYIDTSAPAPRDCGFDPRE